MTLANVGFVMNEPVKRVGTEGSTENGKDHPGSASSSLITLVDLQPPRKSLGFSNPNENYPIAQLSQALLV